jgi:hypothetical protein
VYFDQLEHVEDDRQRLDQGSLDKTQAIRNRNGIVGRQQRVFAEKARVRRGAHEYNLQTVVRMTAKAELATLARYGGFEGHSLADLRICDAGTGGHDHARRFVAEHVRVYGGVAADPSIQVVMQITAANPDGSNLDQDFPRPGLGRLRYFAFFKPSRSDKLNRSHKHHLSL